MSLVANTIKAHYTPLNRPASHYTTYLRHEKQYLAVAWGQSKADIIWAETGSKIMNLISSVQFSFSIYLFFLNRSHYIGIPFINKYSETYLDTYIF